MLSSHFVYESCMSTDLDYIIYRFLKQCAYLNSFKFSLCWDCGNAIAWFKRSKTLCNFLTTSFYQRKPHFILLQPATKCISTKSQLNKLMAQSLLYVFIVFHCSFGGSFFSLSRVPGVCVLLCANKTKNKSLKNTQVERRKRAKANRDTKSG